MKQCFVKSTRDKHMIAITDLARRRHAVHLTVGIQTTPPSPPSPLFLIRLHRDVHPPHFSPSYAPLPRPFVLLMIILFMNLLLLLFSCFPPHAHRNLPFLFMLYFVSFSFFSSPPPSPPLYAHQYRPLPPSIPPLRASFNTPLPPHASVPHNFSSSSSYFYSVSSHVLCNPPLTPHDSVSYL